MKFLAKINSVLEIVIDSILYLLLSILVLVSFAQIILRNFFSESIPWGDIFLRHIVLWIAFLGAAIAVNKYRHISIDIGKRFLNEKLQKIILIITQIFAAVICFFLFQASNEFVFSIVSADEILLLKIPTQYFILILPIGYLIISIRFIFNSIFLVSEIFNGNWKHEESIS